LSFSRGHKAHERRSPRLTAINVFDTENANGQMWQFIVQDMIESRLFAAPISRISFEPGHPIRPQIAAYLRRDV
jgi:hypothetical protein